MMSTKKRQYGSYYTEKSPFALRPFKDWAEAAGLEDCVVLEPFAGANNIVRMLQDAGMCSKFACFDISTSANKTTGADLPPIRRRDTLRRFPTGYRACITNPPWLARNSAHRRGLKFDVPDIYDDVYKYALELALARCDYAAFIIPATFLRSGLFRDRLRAFVLLERRLFVDTDNPVCLALFTPRPRRTGIWADDVFLGWLDDLEKKYRLNTYAPSHRRIRFNSPNGMLGLRGVDNTREASICFCHGTELSHRTVKHSDRSITRIDLGGIRVTSQLIDHLNRILYKFRRDTHDVFLAPFKGLRGDGHYRRRLDFATTRGLVSRNV